VAIPDPVGISAGIWKGVFEDHFLGTTMDTATWQTHLIEGDAFRCNDSSQEVEWSPHSNAGISLANDSNLTITVRKEDPRNSGSVGYDPLCPTTLLGGNVPTHSSATIQSHQGFNFSYGYCEIRVRQARVDGTVPGNNLKYWSSFWLYGADAHWPFEIDVYEYGENQGGATQVVTRYFQPDGSQPGGSNVGLPDVTIYHVYGMSWSPTGVKWYIDGSQVTTYSGSISNLPMHLVYDIMVLSGTPATPATGCHAIDYIRAWVPVGVPNPPTITNVTRTTSTSITVTFSAVSGATSYRATASPWDGTADGVNLARSAAPAAPTGASSPLVCTGLTSGARYQVMVCAINATGYSQESALSGII
jgi:beta-glucanase (GH16 family)